ncbi:MAG: MBL fold metallo-hydrolase [Candidatus Saganbacteria bacterium]|nr:MBL fold metallo-hydrolase [Candidatus Saganbacteria bacterium]
MKQTGTIELTMLYDNTACGPGLEPDWGFSTLLKFSDRTLLFDTGGDPEVLVHNLKALKIDPTGIDSIFISHADWDHINGLPVVLRPGQKVYLLQAFPDKLKREVGSTGAELVEVSGWQELWPGVFTTGEMGDKKKEQALAVRTDNGLVIITGCAHPGIVQIVRRVKERLKEPIGLVLGGFHLYEMNKAQVKEIIAQLKSLGVARFAPCHCSGESAIRTFALELGQDFVEISAGSRLEV